MFSFYENKVKIGFIALLCSFMATASLFGQQKDTLNFSFADPLTDNMVVQQNKAFTVWGMAPAQSKVTISADWTSPVTVTTGENGKFKGIISVPSIEKGNFKQHTLKIESGSQFQTLKNILIGDVWICSGQSNMQFGMDEVINSKEEIANADQPHIRLFNTALNFSSEPIQNVNGKWVECSPETVKKFSAVGYYFGNKIYKELDIPIGLLFTGIGASAAQAYVPQEVLANDPVLDSVYLEPYLQSEKSKEKINGGFSFEKVTRPFLLYNALIYPFTNLSVKGIVWYQGESNRQERQSYTRMMYKMIESWREAFGQGNLPFYYVQVAPFFYDIEDPKMADYAFFREAQENILELDNTEMVLTMDVGEAKNLHPKNKKPVGERLARTALNRTYNFLKIAYQGPHFQSVRFENGKALVSFTSKTVKGGLHTNDGQAPKFFQLAGADRIFHFAEAKIVDNKIEVSSSDVQKPVAVRYAFTNYPVTNLENGNGLPAVPFRSDDWKEPENIK